MLNFKLSASLIYNFLNAGLYFFRALDRIDVRDTKPLKFFS